MIYNLNTFLQPLSPNDIFISIVGPDKILKYSISGFNIKDVKSVNNIIKIFTNTKTIILGFSSTNESRSALEKIMDQIKIIKGRTPNRISKDVENYIGEIPDGGGSASSLSKEVVKTVGLISGVNYDVDDVVSKYFGYIGESDAINYLFSFSMNDVIVESDLNFETVSDLKEYMEENRSNHNNFSCYFYIDNSIDAPKVYGRNMLYWKLRKRYYDYKSLDESNSVISSQMVSYMRSIDSNLISLDDIDVMKLVRFTSKKNTVHSYMPVGAYSNIPVWETGIGLTSSSSATYNKDVIHYIEYDSSGDVNDSNLVDGSDSVNSIYNKYYRATTSIIALYRMTSGSQYFYVLKPYNQDIYSVNANQRDLSDDRVFLFYIGGNRKRISKIDLLNIELDGCFTGLEDVNGEIPIEEMKASRDRQGSFFLYHIDPPKLYSRDYSGLYCERIR